MKCSEWWAAMTEDELTAIEARAKDRTETNPFRGTFTTRGEGASPVETIALVSEVRRLQACLEIAVSEEREAVAAYLRRIGEYGFEDLAARIERGEHRK